MTCDKPNCARQLGSGCIGWTEPPTDCPGYTTDPERVLSGIRACMDYSEQHGGDSTSLRQLLSRYARAMGVRA